MDINKLEALERIAELKRQGVLDEEEFKSVKQRILLGEAYKSEEVDETPVLDKPIEETQSFDLVSWFSENFKKDKIKTKGVGSNNRQRVIVWTLILLVVVVAIGLVMLADRNSSLTSKLDTNVDAIKDQVDTLTLPTTTSLDKGLIPYYARVRTQSRDRTLEFYIQLSDESKKPLSSSAGANFQLKLSDLKGRELYKNKFVLKSSDFARWTHTLLGNKEDQAGFIINIPMGDVKGSHTGTRGKFEYDLDFGEYYWSSEEEMSGLPEASEAEVEAALSADFISGATELPVEKAGGLVIDPLLDEYWVFKATRAGCYEIVDFLGKVKKGIRVDLEVNHASNKVLTFNMDGLLETPKGLLIENSTSNSSLFLMKVPPDISDDINDIKFKKGYYFFEVSECAVGEYRFMVSNYFGTHLDFTFNIR